MRDLVKMTLAQQIYTILREDIITQKIKCGEKLTLIALQNRFNISTTPIRDAMNRLNQENLIDHVTNVGAKVIELSKDDIREIYDLCRILDTAAFKFALSGDQVEEFAEKLTESVRLQEEALTSGNLKDFLDHSDQFHDIFFQFAHNSRLYGASLKLRSQLSILTTKYQNVSIAKDIVFREHKEIAEAVANQQFDRAEELLLTHFDHSKNYMLKNVPADE